MSLTRIELHLPGVRLMTVNEMLRAGPHARARRRDALRDKLLYQLAATRQQPRAPLRFVEITVTHHTDYPLDVDSKHGSLKHLLDCITRGKSDRALYAQSLRQKGSVFIPLGLIHDDTDGEHDLGGCIRRLTVIQTPSKRPAITLVIQEVPA